MIELPKQAVTHSNLAQKILLHWDANGQRAFALWTCLRMLKLNSIDFEEVISLLEQETGKTRQTCIRWVKEGIKKQLFNSDKKEKKIGLNGKEKIFELYLKGELPGIAILTDSNFLVQPKLQKLRGTLNGTFSVKKDVFISRKKISERINVCEETTRNYDKQIKHRRQFQFVLQSDGSGKQTANIYKRSKIYLTRSRIQMTYEQVNDERISNYLPFGRSSERGRASVENFRILFQSKEKAEEVALSRAKKGLSNNTTFYIAKSDELKGKTSKEVLKGRFSILIPVVGDML